MSYCGPKGIPLSRFLSWSEQDQDAALAWQSYENRRCPGCGTHPDDWNEKQGGSRWAYHGEVYTCPGCVESQRLNDSPEVQNGGRGKHVRLAAGSHADCVRCVPKGR
jgi:hypothetical protein